MSPIYDTIGRDYASQRRPDPRWFHAIRVALGGAASVVNVGAGTGSYEPPETRVAIEPSRRMIAQRAAGAAPVVRAKAEKLPLASGSFDAALAVLTVHHWSRPEYGLRELRRVARERVVVVTWDPTRDFWLTRAYVPAIAAFDRQRFLPIESIVDAHGNASVEPLPVPRDCEDGFLAAFWARPRAYLDPKVRAAISGFAQLPAAATAPGLAELAADLESGRWEREHASDAYALDAGYRLIVSCG